MDSSAFIGKVVSKLNADIVAPVSLDRRTWELSVDHQAGDVYTIRSASLLSDSPVIFACDTSYRIVGVVVCVKVPKTPGLAAR